MGKRDDAIDALAKLFSGTAVVHNSIGLSLGGAHKATADAYFAARDKLGVRGYADVDEATEAIKRVLT